MVNKRVSEELLPMGIDCARVTHQTRFNARQSQLETLGLVQEDVQDRLERPRDAQMMLRMKESSFVEARDDGDDEKSQRAKVDLRDDEVEDLGEKVRSERLEHVREEQVSTVC